MRGHRLIVKLDGEALPASLVTSNVLPSGPSLRSVMKTSLRVGLLARLVGHFVDHDGPDCIWRSPPRRRRSPPLFCLKPLFRGPAVTS